MANLSSIARPYALAAFEYARDHQQLPSWKNFLETASIIARDQNIVRMMANPELSSSRLFELFTGILSSQMNAEENNFLKLLSEHKRLNVLPEILDLFNTHYAQLEKVSKVRVVTATETQEAFRKKLAEHLTKRIQHEVTLQCEIDPSIIGGAVIHIGDRVIDGSIRGKLSRLLVSLTG